MNGDVKYLGGNTLGKPEDVGEDGDGFSPCPNVFGAAVYVLCYVKVWLISVVLFLDNDHLGVFWDGGRSWFGGGGGSGDGSSRYGSNLAVFFGHGCSFFWIMTILKKRNFCRLGVLMIT